MPRTTLLEMAAEAGRSRQSLRRPARHLRQWRPAPKVLRPAAAGVSAEQPARSTG